MKKILLPLFVIFQILFISCENEPFEAGEINMNTLDDELLNFMALITDDPGEEAVNCIEFNYSFTIFIFDANLELENAVSIFNNNSFANLLDSLDTEQSISINYPITGTLSNGEFVDINTNEELLVAIKECSQEELMRRYGSRLKACNSRIVPQEEFPNDYENDVLKLLNEGLLELHHESSIFYGTWVTLYIGDILYINIDLNDDDEIENFWNHNWEVLESLEETTTIKNEEIEITIKKDCTELCETDQYEVCEEEDTPGFAIFDFSEYTPCISILTPQTPLDAVEFSFHETEQDARDIINPLNTTMYTNLENLQTIYVRVFYKTSGELIEISTIILNAIPCIN